MRILILTHGRSGGLSLMAWIGHELRIASLHEPFNDNELPDDLFTNKNLVVKEFPRHIIKIGYDLNEFVSTFDKVIIHKRLSVMNSAISASYITQTKYAHHTYEINNKWLIDNKDLIDNNQKTLIEEILLLDKYDFNCIRTTYEGIYYTKEDIKKITEYLEITSPCWLDILDNKRKLRNGNIGMYNFLSTPTPTPTPNKLI